MNIVAKWFDETKDAEMLTVTRGLEEKFTQRSTPRQRAVRRKAHSKSGTRNKMCEEHGATRSKVGPGASGLCKGGKTGTGLVIPARWNSRTLRICGPSSMVR